jgi:hypothetical protein
MSDAEVFSVESARDAAQRDELGEWVARFLGSAGSDNTDLAEQLSDRVGSWIGPLKVPIDRLHRLAGPPGEPVLCPVDDDYWGDNVDKMEAKVEDGWEPPPVIVTYRDDQLVLEDGTHRVESLRRADARDTWAIIGFADAHDREAFTAAMDAL